MIRACPLLLLFSLAACGGIDDKGAPCSRGVQCQGVCKCGPTTKPCEETKTCTLAATEPGQCAAPENVQCGCYLDSQGIPRIAACP